MTVMVGSEATGGRRELMRVGPEATGSRRWLPPVGGEAICNSRSLKRESDQLATTASAARSRSALDRAA
jgi:hypothetical protein